MKNTEPLSQRTSGRRSRRLEERKELQERKYQSDGRSGSSGSPLPPAAVASAAAGTPQSLRRTPNAELERQIDEAIEVRKRELQSKENNKNNTTTTSSVDDHDDKDECHDEIWGKYEFLDHTADVQLHSWGDSLGEALEDLTLSMFAYMTPLRGIRLNDTDSDCHGTRIVASGHDLHSLVFAHLQEWLTIFHETGFVAKQLHVEEVDLDRFTTISSAKGERFDPTRHVQGTEVKAVTYSNLQVVETKGGGDGDDDDEASSRSSRWDIWVIVDI